MSSNSSALIGNATYFDMFDVFQLHNITLKGIDVPVRQVPEFYSRYLDFGFNDKFSEIQ